MNQKKTKKKQETLLSVCEDGRTTIPKKLRELTNPKLFSISIKKNKLVLTQVIEKENEV